MRYFILRLSVAAMSTVVSTPALTQVKSAEPGELAAAFCLAWEQHDAKQLGRLFLPDADFVNVGALWIHGADVETFHSRLFKGRFRNSKLEPLNLKVRYLRPDVAIVRWSWRIEVALADGSSVPARFGLMTMIAEKKGPHWLISNAQNTNSGPATPEAEGLKLPLEVPRAL